MRIVGVTSYKGGVGKTTTAVHLCANLADLGAVRAIDADPNLSLTKWARRSEFGFEVCSLLQASTKPRVEHLLIDTAARPDREDLADLVAQCDFLVIPSTPDALSLEALLALLKQLEGLRFDRYKVLLTICPSGSSGLQSSRVLEARKVLGSVPVFRQAVRRLVAYQDAAGRGGWVSGGDYAAVSAELRGDLGL